LGDKVGGPCSYRDDVEPSAVSETSMPLPSIRSAGIVRKTAAGSEGFRVGCGYGSDLLSPASLSAGRHPARRVAVPSLHPKLSRCRGAACRAWARHLLRERSQLGAQIRTGDRSESAAVPSSTERSLASRRNG